jgi:3-oxoacyl-[acyl-carrier protein] reductase
MNDQKVAIVTGASGGIGGAVARELASRQYAVALLGTNEAALTAIADELSSSGARTLALPGDLADLTYAESAVEQTAAKFGRVDVLVNNAAWREIVTMREITIESWERTLRICLTAPAFLARWCAANMQPRQQGVIINVTSIMSQQTAGCSPAYVACKGALETLTYELAALYGPHGIRVVSVAPGAIETPFGNDLASRQTSPAEQALREYSESMIVLGRWGTPSETAKAIAWIASDEAAYITATTLVVDGGWMRHHLPTSLVRRLQPGKL